MSGSGNWLEELEQKLEQQLESFLRSNPLQDALLAEQAARDRQQALLLERRRLQQQAEQQRQELLRLAAEIRQWQQRVERARAAAAHDLAGRAETHIAGLMEQGRHRWRALGDLGQRFTSVSQELEDLTRPSPSGDRGRPDLEAEWSRFEAQQELEDLRRRVQH